MTNDEIANLLAASIDSNDNDNVQQIPRHFDGRDYAIENLALDQRETLVHVLQVLRQYCDGQIENEDEVFCLTVSGGAGSGKSTWINTLVTLIRRLFNSNDSIGVYGPTGSAAYNAGGETINRGFRVPLSKISLKIDARKQIAEDCSQTIAVRFQVSQLFLVLFQLENHTSDKRAPKCRHL